MTIRVGSIFDRLLMASRRLPEPFWPGYYVHVRVGQDITTFRSFTWRNPR